MFFSLVHFLHTCGCIRHSMGRCVTGTVTDAGDIHWSSSCYAPSGYLSLSIAIYTHIHVLLLQSIDSRDSFPVTYANLFLPRKLMGPNRQNKKNSWKEIIKINRRINFMLYKKSWES